MLKKILKQNFSTLILPDANSNIQSVSRLINAAQ